jgi:hypothetical protein
LSRRERRQRENRDQRNEHHRMSVHSAGDYMRPASRILLPS